MEYSELADRLNINSQKDIFVFKEETILLEQDMRSLIEHYLTQEKLSIDPSLLNYPSETTLHWEYKYQDKFLWGGQVNLKNISLVLYDKDHYALKKYKDNQLITHDKYRFWDKDLLDGELIGTAIKQEGKELSLIYILEDTFFELSLQPNEYIKMLSLTRGFPHWQLLFVKEKFNCMKDLYLKIMLRDFPTLFPKDNFSILYKKFNAIG